VLKVVGVINTTSASELLRIKMPYSMLNGRYGVFNWVRYGRLDLMEQYFAQYNVVVLERLFAHDYEVARATFDYYKSTGQIVVFDVDDDFTSIPAENPASKTITPEVVEKTELVVQECNAVTVSTEYLAGKLRRLNEHVYVVPNCLDLAMWGEVERTPREERDHLVIGWFGSASHVVDLPELEHAWTRLAKKYPQVRFVAGGFCTESLKKALGDRLTVYGWVPLSRYPALVKMIDIGCMPLADLEFNYSKSNLKFLEFGALGIPTVASPVGPYGDLKGEVNVLHARTSSLWYEQLSRLIEDSELRRRIGANARETVYANHDMNKRAYQWFQTYAKIRAAIDPAIAFRPCGVWI
jgi:glycosyltransferase involved in cell wall biosynthesis